MRRSIFTSAFLFLLLTPLSGCLLFIRHALNDDEVKEITIKGKTRRYILHVPEGYTSQSEPDLVVVLHGGGGNGRNAEKMSGFTERSNRDGFLVLYPYGTSRLFDENLLTWNAGNCCGSALDQKVDDVTFLRQLILFIRNQYHVRKVYVTGMSNGGMMTYRMACESGDIIDGIAPVAGAMNVENCKAARPLDVIIFHGREDRHVLHAGGRPQVKADKHDRIDRSVAFAEAYWQSRNGCRDRKAVKTGKVERVSYTCDGGKLTVISIDGEGHTWPGGKKGHPGADAPTQEISATDEMLKFWKE
jgi:polyhydroxybutyrate depolymerase